MPFMYMSSMYRTRTTPRQGFGYALSMIRRNEKLGEQPFFAHVKLYPADAVTGTVVTPDGKPAEAVKVSAFRWPTAWISTVRPFPRP